MDADGSGRKGFGGPGLIGLARPAFDPTGTQLAFQGVGTDGRRDIYIRNIDTRVTRRLRSPARAEPAWGSDGRIAFTRAGNIYVIKPTAPASAASPARAACRPTGRRTRSGWCSCAAATSTA